MTTLSIYKHRQQSISNYSEASVDPSLAYAHAQLHFEPGSVKLQAKYGPTTRVARFEPDPFEICPCTALLLLEGDTSVAVSFRTPTYPAKNPSPSVGGMVMINLRDRVNFEPHHTLPPKHFVQFSAGKTRYILELHRIPLSEMLDTNVDDGSGMAYAYRPHRLIQVSV